MAKKKPVSNQDEAVKYYGNIPKIVVENMTPEVRVQYFYWDELLKRQIQVHPVMFLSLVKEIFGKEYPDGTDITILSAEYVMDKPYAGGKLIESIRSDLVVRIGGKDLYHMECQMKQGGDIAVRMLEYDVNAALLHGLERIENTRKEKGKNIHPYKYKLTFPKSAILYLDSTERTPDEESCIVVLPNDTEYEYSIPVLKVQAYTPEMMAQKGLSILFPFSPIRFRRRLDAILKMEKKGASFEEIQEKKGTLKKDLTKFVLDCIMIIKREEENGTLKDSTGTDIVEYMGRTCDYIFGKEPELLKGVHEVMEPVIKLIREEAEDTIKQKDAEIKQMEERLDKFMQNYICQCKKEGKVKEQVEKELQNNFSLPMQDVKKKMEEWW